MRLEEINALRGLDVDELIAKAAEVDVEVHRDDIRSIKWPSLDSIRLAIVEATIEREGGGSKLSALGAEHFHEARKAHLHGLEFARKAEGESDRRLAGEYHSRAEAYFAVARSAAALAQVGCTAAALEATADFLKSIG